MGGDPEGHSLSDLAWAAVKPQALVLVPLGSTEQHGPHLPLSTDTTIATAVAHAVARRLGAQKLGESVVVAPPINYGASGEHQDFPGTMSIGNQALVIHLIELARSMSSWAGRVVLVNGHGGNVRSLIRAVGDLIVEGHDISWTPCAADEMDAHAGHAETSLMLHLAPDLVRMSQATKGNLTPLEHLMPRILERGVSDVSATGVLGDPTLASATDGARIFALIVNDVTARIQFDRRLPSGCLERPQGLDFTRSATAT